MVLRHEMGGDIRTLEVRSAMMGVRIESPQRCYGMSWDEKNNMQLSFSIRIDLEEPFF